MNGYAGIIRNVNFADRFLLVHSDPLYLTEQIDALSKRLEPTLHNPKRVIM